MSNQHPVLDVKDIPSPFQWLTLSLQHLFAMFGSTVLVPVLVGLSPAIALISSGIATILFLIFTKWQVPAYLGSSFAFIAPIIAAKASEGTGGAMIGCFMIGVVYIIVALIIKQSGYQWIMKLLPPVVVGPVIMVIGLALAPTAIGMAMNNPVGEYDLLYFSAGLVTLLSTILFSVFSKGFLGQISILAGIIVGYIYSVLIGIVDFTPVLQAGWFEWPEFVVPFIDYEVTFSTDIMLTDDSYFNCYDFRAYRTSIVLSKVVGRDYIKEPGLHRSILGDGLGTMISALIGGPPKTTYGENIGVLAITKVYSVYIILGAAVFALILGFVGKITALINTIPQPVMGGVSILLFGIIASSGLRMLIDNKVDFSKNRNLAIASVILVLGIGGAFIQVSDKFSLQGMAFAAIAGVILNLVLPGKEKSEKDIFETQID